MACHVSHFHDDVEVYFVEWFASTFAIERMSGPRGIRVALHPESIEE